MGTYNPHILECYGCNVSFVDGQEVYPFYEDYICVPCTPLHIQEQTKPIIWRKSVSVQLRSNNGTEES
jgi:hypothetical protein